MFEYEKKNQKEIHVDVNSSVEYTENILFGLRGLLLIPVMTVIDTSHGIINQSFELHHPILGKYCEIL